MGLHRNSVRLLFEEAKRRPFEGKVLTLGRQNILFSYDHLKETASKDGFKLPDLDKITFSHNKRWARRGYMSDVSFLKSLGFSESKALDISSREAPDYLFDLNGGETPEDLLEEFDVIIDGGTIEHTFHIPNVLNNIFRMLRKGGRIIHFAPSSNHIDHGFYMFSPMLFWEFYEVNKFEINTLQVVKYVRAEPDDWEISEYHSGRLKSVSMGGLDGSIYLIWCIVTKMKNSTGDVIPMQRGKGFYTKKRKANGK